MMKFKHTMKVIAVGLLMATALMSHAAQPHSVTAQQLAQKSFAAPEEAGKDVYKRQFLRHNLHHCDLSRCFDDRCLVFAAGSKQDGKDNRGER